MERSCCWLSWYLSIFLLICFPSSLPMCKNKWLISIMSFHMIHETSFKRIIILSFTGCNKHTNILNLEVCRTYPWCPIPIVLCYIGKGRSDRVPRFGLVHKPNRSKPSQTALHRLVQLYCPVFERYMAGSEKKVLQACFDIRYIPYQSGNILIWRFCGPSIKRLVLLWAHSYSTLNLIIRWVNYLNMLQEFLKFNSYLWKRGSFSRSRLPTSFHQLNQLRVCFFWNLGTQALVLHRNMIIYKYG